MSQIKFEIAEFLVNNQTELKSSLSKEINLEALSEQWYIDNNVLNYFTEAFSDFVVYKIKGFITDNTSFTFQEITENVDKGLVADLLGTESLTVNYWRNHG